MTETQLTPSDLTKLLHIAEQAARDAGHFLMQALGKAHVASQKSSHDDLLDVDLQAERIILTKLQELSPAIGLLSEETGQTGNEALYWLVDPLDGSANFQHGSPLFAISIALIEHQKSLIGVIYSPESDEMFEAGGKVTQREQKGHTKLYIYSNGWLHRKIENVFFESKSTETTK